MAHVYTDNGRDFVEDVLTGESTETLTTISIGTGESAPSTGDTSLDSFEYEATPSSSNITIERGNTTGEIRVVIGFTGGTEVPADSDITEFGVKTSDNTLFYREVRSSAVTPASGETKNVEIRLFVEDNIISQQQVITDVGKEYIADALIGVSTDTLNTIAVGSGTNNVSASDTSLQNEIYRGTDNESNISLQSTSNTGTIDVEISLSAGPDTSDEVSPNAEISEFGVLTSSDVLVLHETRVKIVLEENDTKKFTIPFTIIQ